MNTKNIILDKPFKDDIRLPLSKGETILWEGAPIYNKQMGREKFYPNLPQSFRKQIEGNFTATFAYFALIVFIATLSGALTINIFIGFFIIIFSLSIIISFPDLYFTNKRINTTSYILTSKQMIFKFGGKSNKRVHALPLHQIKNVTINKNTNHPKCGYIVFHLDKKYKLSFHTYNLFTGDMHSKLTLSMIENVGEVFTLLQSTISKSKRDEY